MVVVVSSSSVMSCDIINVTSLFLPVFFFESAKKMATNNDLSSRFAWRDDLVRELIELYREKPCLYDTRSKQYHNRDLRRKCYEEIAEHLGSTSKFDRSAKAFHYLSLILSKV